MAIKSMLTVLSNYTSSYVFTNWCIIIMADFQTLNWRYFFGIQPKWAKFCVALHVVTRYDLLS